MLRENKWGLNDPVHANHVYYKCWVDFCWSVIEKARDNVQDALNTAGQAAGAAAGAATSGVANTVENVGNAIGDTAQKVGDATGLSGVVNTIGEKTGLKELGQNIHEAYKYGAGITEDNTPQYNAAAEQQKQDAATESTARDEAMSQGAATASQEAAASAKQAASEGVNKSRAGMLGSQAASSGQSNIQGLYNAAKQQTNTTNADYVQKMKQADALDTQAKYMNKAVPLATASSALQGASQGAQLGFQLSDERCKQPSDGIDDDKLIEAIDKYKSLYLQLKQLKGDK